MSALHAFDWGLGLGTLMSAITFLIVWARRGRPVR